MPWYFPPFFLPPTRHSEPSPEVEATVIELASLRNEATSNLHINEDIVMTSTQPEQGPSPLGERVSRKRRLSEPARQNNERLTKRANMASGSMGPDLHQATDELSKMEERFRSTLYELHMKNKELSTRLHDLQTMANTLKKYVDDLVTDSA